MAASDYDLVGGPFAVIESDPGVFTTLLRRLGVSGLEVTEIYDIEPWSVDHLNPHGLVFCYLCDDDGEESILDDELKDPDAERVWFANQLSDDACAVQAILNVLLNCPDIDIGERLQEFRSITERMSPVMRGLALSGSQFIREAQNSLARPADLRGAFHAIATTTMDTMKAKATTPKKRKTSGTSAKSKRKTTKTTDKLEAYHFIGYVPSHNKVWELDGLRESALEVGEIIAPEGSFDSKQGWMDIVRPALRMKMQTVIDGSDHIRYNLLAIVDDPYCGLVDQLEMLKRERNALERRLNGAYPEGWADKVDQTLAASASETFTTSLRPSSEGRVFSRGFGAQKMDKEIEILDMPSRRLPAAWEDCVKAAMPVKLAIEDEAAKSREAHTEEIKRTFDYEPFINQFITCMHNEGLLDTALHDKAADDSVQQQSKMSKNLRSQK